ncbi:MAG: T9SS type A sorting domain-containing protein [Ginsengibacter sp.]
MLKKSFYILLLLFAGLHFNANAQSKKTLVAETDKTVRFYPNPAISYINFEFEKNYDNNNSLIIYNFLGKKILEQKIGEQKINVSLTNFFRGIYIFQLCDQQGKVIESGKFQVAK